MSAVQPPQPVQPPLPPQPQGGGLKPGGLIGIISGAGALIIAISIGVFALLLPPVLQVPTQVAVGEEEQGEATGVQALYGDLNAALQAQDRDAFMSHVSGDAVAPLNLWWDNLDKIGWTAAGISEVQYGTESPEAGASTEVPTIFGAAMGFSAFSPRGSGSEDAGKSFIQGFPYDVTISNDGDLKITGWKPTYAVTPWESGELYVAKSDHVVLSGLVADKALVDSSLPAAEEAAQWVLNQYADAGRELPLDGFTAFITDDDSTFALWLTDETTSTWRMDPAGFAKPTLRPNATAGLDPLIARGDNTSTGVVSIGPGALDNLAAVMAHEFVHVVHYTEVSGSFGDPPLTTIEGWARYQEKRFASGSDTFPSRDSTLSSCVDGFLPADGSTPTDEQLRGTDAYCYYELAASRYAYAAANGYDVYKLSNLAKVAGLDPIAVSSDLDGDAELSDAGWAEWVSTNY